LSQLPPALTSAASAHFIRTREAQPISRCIAGLPVIDSHWAATLNRIERQEIFMPASRSSRKSMNRAASLF
jgi:hypothetical protein